MKSHATVRKAEVKDAPKTRELFLELLKSYPKAYLSTWEEEKKLDVGDEVAKLKKISRRPTSNFFVAEVGNKIVGMVICHGHEKRKIRHQATVEKLGVLPEYCRRGIGTLLLKHLLDWVRDETKISRLDLWVILSNPKVLSFYQKFGFEKEAVIGKACRIGDKFYDSVIMVKWFER